MRRCALLIPALCAVLCGAAAQDSPKSAQPAPKLNKAKVPGPAPAGMVWIPGGEFYMGVDADKLPESFSDLAILNFVDAAPVHKVYVDGFWMDKTEVTNEEFAKFVKATGYVTIAERKPDPKDFPDVPADKVPAEPFSIVFKQPGPDEIVDLREGLAWWRLVRGASWKHPEGPKSNLTGREKHPGVHVCWEDAVAYCKWAKKRLPTEAEWEFAARGGLDRKLYPWGDKLKPDGKWMCNVWQGEFPRRNTKEDGFETTAPVASFPANGYGLHDMAGNVWEWCADYYQPDYYKKSPARNPKGPASGVDKDSKEIKRVQRGGSYLCADSYCMGFLCGARGKGEQRSAATHIGFRCAKDPETKPANPGN